MMSAAPRNFAPSVAHRPIGPCAKTATLSPTRTFPLSAPDRPGREDVRHQHDLFVGQAVGNRREIRASVGDEQILGPGAVDGVAEAPAAKRPVALRVRRVEAVETLPARRDGADDDALSDEVVVLQPVTERVDHPDRLVAEDETRLHRVFALDDVHVGAANGRGGDANHRLAGSRDRFLPFLDLDNAGPAEHGGFHQFHDVLDS